MRATVMFGASDVRIENVPDATIIEPLLKLSLIPFSKQTPSKAYPAIAWRF